jgi:hypothetical protein
MLGKLTQRQFINPQAIVLAIDGSDVTTSYATTALDVGKHIATVKKGAGADSNLVTILLNKPLGMAPMVMFQETTLDCICRLEAATTVDTIKVRTLELDGVTKEDNADFSVFLFSSEHGEKAEGSHL